MNGVYVVTISSSDQEAHQREPTLADVHWLMGYPDAAKSCRRIHTPATSPAVYPGHTSINAEVCPTNEIREADSQADQDTKPLGRIHYDAHVAILYDGLRSPYLALTPATLYEAIKLSSTQSFARSVLFCKLRSAPCF